MRVRRRLGERVLLDSRLRIDGLRGRDIRKLPAGVREKGSSTRAGKGPPNVLGEGEEEGTSTRGSLSLSLGSQQSAA
jgi:hypothetical protein